MLVWHESIGAFPAARDLELQPHAAAEAAAQEAHHQDPGPDEGAPRVHAEAGPGPAEADGSHGRGRRAVGGLRADGPEGVDAVGAGEDGHVGPGVPHALQHGPVGGPRLAEAAQEGGEAAPPDR
eukprot:scaffold244894_cov32-Prasinocladus_malaysianus.AAC.1